MSAKTKEWAERVGREAVGLGFVEWFEANLHDWLPAIRRPEFIGVDFRDRLTELAAIAWLEDVARETYGDGWVRLDHHSDGECDIEVWSYSGGTRMAQTTAPTLAEACILAVKAMKGVS